MNNKPVGYFGKDPYGNWEELNENHGIPLYTHPAKTLTDEEILEVGNAVTNLIDSNEGWIEFARAILRKAQEK
jgi:hypothetical protein